MSTLGRRLLGWVPRTRGDWGRLLLGLAAWAIVLAMIGGVVAPIFEEVTSHGTHDWDQMEAHRYLVAKSILEYGQFPFWNPYSCGGHTAWGGFESGTIVVSPWLPFYLTLELPMALRLEIVGAAVVSALGSWLFAGRFTTSAALRALVCVLFVVNGRWAWQISTGHTWHLYYCWTPWVLFFFDRAAAVGHTRGVTAVGTEGAHATTSTVDAFWSDLPVTDVTLMAVCIAMLVYNGGIYPLPHTVAAVGLYGSFLAIRARSWRPLVVGAAGGALALLFAAPKLLPMLEVFGRYPRLVDSDEKFDLYALVQVFTARESNAARVSRWGWHEWGIYIGWAGVLVLLAGAIFARGRRESAMKWSGIVFMVLGLGAFHELAPWTLVHEYVPVFKSLHVPSRWQYPGVLMLGAVTAAWLDRLLERTRHWRPAFEALALAGVAAIAVDIATVSQGPLRGTFGRRLPNVEPETSDYHQEKKVPRHLHYPGRGDWAAPALPAMIANVGTIECSTFPGLHSIYRDARDRAPGLGAVGKGDPDYRGEAFFADGTGDAAMTRFTPNELVVAYDHAVPGDSLVLNQNWFPGWRASDGDAFALEDRVATKVSEKSGEVVFRYRPRTWWPGVGLLVLGAAAVSVLGLRRRAARR